MSKDILVKYIGFLLIWIILFPVKAITSFGGIEMGGIFFNLGESLFLGIHFINVVIVIFSFLNLFLFYKIRSKLIKSKKYAGLFSAVGSLIILLVISWVLVYLFTDYFTFINLYVDF